MKKLNIIILILISVLTGCASAPKNFFPANLAGIIFDNYNNPVTGALVTVNSDKEYTSDIDGRFIIPDLDSGKYHVSITKAGFETIETDIDFFDPKQVMYLKMSSLSFLKSAIEADIKKRDYVKAQQQLDRAFKIAEADPVLIYLAAVCSFYQGKYIDSQTYLNRLRESGYSLEPLSGLEMEIEKVLSSK